MATTLVMLLAGGRGSRLDILAAHRAKPAVPFAGMFRIVDFALTNCMYAKLHRGGVLTQYRPSSLMKHLGDGKHWNFAGKDGMLRVLPPFQGEEDMDWYHGTADAVYQNLDFIWRHRPDRVLVLSGDHIYRMDYRAFLDFHQDNDADLTIASMPVPWEEASRFGIIVADGDRRIEEFQEKPEKPGSNLASMGIYVFKTEVLFKVLESVPRDFTDFGQHVIPTLLERGNRLYTYPFEGYWRDVGTIDSYFEANMDVLRPDSGMSLTQWRPRTNLYYEEVVAMPPALVMGQARVEGSMICAGCRVEGTVVNSILSPGVVVEKGAVVRDSIVMHRTHIGRDAVVTRSIVDKRCGVGARAVLGSGDNGVPNQESPRILTTGLVVVGKGAVVPEGASVGPNVIVHPGVVEDDFARFSRGDIPAGQTIRCQSDCPGGANG